MNRRTVKITLLSGNEIITAINGTEETIRNYYAIGSIVGCDNNDPITGLEFLD